MNLTGNIRQKLRQKKKETKLIKLLQTSKGHPRSLTEIAAARLTLKAGECFWEGHT